MFKTLATVATIALPALFDLLEAEGWDYAIRNKGKALSSGVN